MALRKRFKWPIFNAIATALVVVFLFYWFVYETLMLNLRFSEQYSRAMLRDRALLKSPKYLREQFNYSTKIEYSYVEKFLDVIGVDMSYTIFMKKCAAGEIVTRETSRALNSVPTLPGAEIVIRNWSELPADDPYRIEKERAFAANRSPNQLAQPVPPKLPDTPKFTKK